MFRALVLLILLAPCGVAAESNLVQQAVAEFQQAKYAEAAALFAKAAECGELTAEQQTAWAYCRLRQAAETWNASRGDAAVGQRVVAEATNALALVPTHAELQKFGREVIVAAGGQPPAPVAPKAAASPKATAAGWYSLETANFRIRYPAAAKSLAESLAVKAEEQRAAIFARWSGPAGSNWTAHCEIVVHASAADFAHATSQPAAATGHALVQLESGKPAVRRIDLRHDDETAAIDALPRELTHVVLADLFPTTPPPRWAADGMSVLAMSPAMVERYLKTAATRAAKSELLPVQTLMTATTITDVTGHAVASTALVDYIVRLKGERSLTLFLRDIQRYGLEKSVERQLGAGSLKALDAELNKDLAR